MSFIIRLAFICFVNINQRDKDEWIGKDSTEIYMHDRRIQSICELDLRKHYFHAQKKFLLHKITLYAMYIQK
jgi:hypothetical protein